VRAIPWCIYIYQFKAPKPSEGLRVGSLLTLFGGGLASGRPYICVSMCVHSFARVRMCARAFTASGAYLSLNLCFKSICQGNGILLVTLACRTKHTYTHHHPPTHAHTPTHTQHTHTRTLLCHAVWLRNPSPSAAAAAAAAASPIQLWPASAIRAGETVYEIMSCESV